MVNIFLRQLIFEESELEKIKDQNNKLLNENQAIQKNTSEIMYLLHDISN